MQYDFAALFGRNGGNGAAEDGDLRKLLQKICGDLSFLKSRQQHSSSAKRLYDPLGYRHKAAGSV